VHDSTSIMGQQDMAVGTAKKSAATSWCTWFARNIRHLWEGGLWCRTMYFATVACETVTPSFNNSP